MTPVHWAAGLVLGAGALGLMLLGGSPVAGSAILPAAFLALGAAVSLSPALIPLLIRLLTAPAALARSRPFPPTGPARVAVPILVTVGLTATLTAATATVHDATSLARQERVKPAVTVLTAHDPAGLSAAALAALAQVPGVTSVVPTRAQDAFTHVSGPVEARFVAPGVTAVLDLPVTAGDLDLLHDPALVPSRAEPGSESGSEPQREPAAGMPGPVAGRTGLAAGMPGLAAGMDVARANGWTLGGEAQIRPANGAFQTLRVVALLPESLDMPSTVLLPWDLSGDLSGSGAGGDRAADTVYVTGSPDPARLAAVIGPAVTVQSPPSSVSRSDAGAAPGDRVMLVVLGLIVLYAVVMILDGLVVTVAQRARGMTARRRAGAGSRRILIGVVGETGSAVAAGLLLAAVVTAALLLGLRFRLETLVGHPGIVVPWPLIIMITVVCAAIALLANLLPAVALLTRSVPVSPRLVEPLPVPVPSADLVLAGAASPPAVHDRIVAVSGEPSERNRAICEDRVFRK